MNTLKHHALQSASPKDYLAYRSERFIADLDQLGVQLAREMLELQVVRFNELDDQLQTCLNAILNLVGVGKEWHEVDAIQQDVRKIVVWLNDIEACALDDPSSVSDMYNSHSMQWQKDLED